MIDCIVVKKYPIYIAEYKWTNNQSHRFLRSRATMEVIQAKQQETCNEMIQ